MATFYVRPIAGTYTPADGTTYATAYDGFAGIDWTDFSAGDTLYVCGTHTETLSAATVNGTAGALFTIRGDYEGDPGIIDGEDTRAYCIDVQALDYYHVKNITVLDAYDSGTNGEGVYVYNSTGTIVDSVTATGCYWNNIQFDAVTDGQILSCTSSGGTNKGITISGDSVGGASVNNLVKDCVCHTNTTDGFVISGVDNTITTTGNRFVNCTSYSNTRYGFHLNNCSYSYCDGCVSYSNGDDNFYLVGYTGTQTNIGNGFKGCTSYSSGDFGYTISLQSNAYMTNCNSGVSGAETDSNIQHVQSLNTLIQNNILVGNAAADIMQIIGVSGRTNGNLKIWGNVFRDQTFNGYAVEVIDLFVPGISVCGNVFDTVNRGIRVLNNTGQEYCNNVFVDTGEAIRVQTAVTGGNAVMSNNIFTHTGDPGNGFIYCVATAANDFTISNNHYYAPSNAGNDFIKYNNVIYTVADYTTIDTTGTDGDPALTTDYKLPSDSALIGTGSKSWTGANPVDRAGEPFSDWDTGKGCYQETDIENNPFHPSNL